MEDNLNINRVKKITSDLSKDSIVCAQQISAGMNSKVFRLVSADSKEYVAKFYFNAKADQRDRLGVEFLSLNFLWKQGVRCIPRPVAQSSKVGCAIYEFVEGEKVDSKQITEGDVDFAVWFLSELKKLTTNSESKTFKRASEAFFSVSTVIDNIQSRLDRLMNVEEQNDDLKDFLLNDFIPFFEATKEWSKSKCEEFNFAFDQEIDESERTLSPSDFGFHNSIRGKDGRIVFVDFEYFGWDDPAKTVCDFLLHPAMDLDNDFKHRFLIGVYASSLGNKKLEKRVEVLYPLFGLKWCMIFLNEFIPEEFKRRHFASVDAMDKRSIQQTQLSKAKRMLTHIKNTYEEFPYNAKTSTKV